MTELQLRKALDESFTTDTALTAKSYHADLENLQKSLSLSENVEKKVPREKDCLPVNHLAFLPMKRTKSFLLQSIFIHFGLKNHLRYIFEKVGQFHCVLVLQCHIPQLDHFVMV